MAGIATAAIMAFAFIEGALYGLTTEVNAVVGSIYAKAMPVILTESDEVDRWLEAHVGEALTLQRPLPDGALLR